MLPYLLIVTLLIQSLVPAWAAPCGLYDEGATRVTSIVREAAQKGEELDEAARLHDAVEIRRHAGQILGAITGGVIAGERGVHLANAQAARALDENFAGEALMVASECAALMNHPDVRELYEDVCELCLAEVDLLQELIREHTPSGQVLRALMEASGQPLVDLGSWVASHPYQAQSVILQFKHLMKKDVRQHRG